MKMFREFYIKYRLITKHGFPQGDVLQNTLNNEKTYSFDCFEYLTLNDLWREEHELAENGEQIVADTENFESLSRRADFHQHDHQSAAVRVVLFRFVSQRSDFALQCVYNL
jgi:hypothetical protein